MGGWVMQGLSGVSHRGVGWGAVWWVIQQNNLKNDSPRNQDFTPPK